MSRRLRIGLSILVGTAVLFVVLIGVLQSPPARRFALRQLTAIVNKQGIDLSAARLDYNLLALTVTLSNVVVRSTAEPDLPPVLQADRVFVDLGLRPLLSGEILIEDASVTNPQVQVVMVAEDRNNIPKTPPSDPNAPKREFLVNRLVVSGGSVTVDDRVRQLLASLPLSQITMTGNAVTRDHQITLASGSPGRLRWEQRQLPIEQLQAEAVLGQNRVEVRRLLLDVGNSEITISGAVPDFESGNAQVQAQATLAPQLIDFAGLPESYKAVAPVGLKAQVQYQQTPQVVTVESLAVESDAALINGTARLALGPNAGTSSAKISAEQVAVELLSRLADSPVAIASTAQLDVEATWPQLEFEQGSASAVVTLRSKGGPSTDKRIPVSGRLRATGSMDRAVVNIERLEARGAQVSGRVSLADQKRLGGDLKVVASDLAQAGVPDLHGPATVSASLGGTIDSPRVYAVVAANGLRYDKYEGIDVNAEAIYANEMVTLPSAVVTYDKNSVSASGTVSLASKSPTLDLTAETSDILLASFSTDLRGTAKANARVLGTVADPTADLEIAVRELVAYQQPVPDIDVDAQIRNQLAQFTISGPLQGTGSYHLKDKSYVIDAGTLPLPITSMEVNGNAIRGIASFSAKGEGTVDNPSGEVKLNTTLLHVGDKDLGSVDAEVQVANKQAQVQASASKFNTNIDGTISTDAPYAADLRIDAKELDLASLPVKDLPVKGTVTFTAQALGPLSRFQQEGQAQATIQPLDLTYNGQPVRSEGEIAASFAGNVVTLQPATVMAGNSRLQLSGTLPVETTAPDGAIQVAGTVDLKSVIPYLPDQQGLLLEGTAQLDGTITGNLKRIDPSLTLRLDKGYFANETFSPPIYNATLSARLEGGAVALESAAFDWGPASFAGSGTIPLSLLPADLPVELPRAQGPAKLVADLKNVDLSTIEGLPDALAGSVSARLEAEANEPKVEAIRGKLTFPQLEVSAGTLRLQQKGVSEFSLENGTATATQFLLTGPNSEVRLSGTAGLAAPNALDLQLKATGDASLVSAFTEKVRARGAMAIEAGVTGTAKDPRVGGFLSLQDANVSVEDPTLSAESLNLRMNFEGDRATIAELTGELNGGPISGSGSLRYADGRLQDTNLKLQATDLYMNVPDGLKTLSNVNLTVTNQQSDVLIGGEVLVEEGGYSKDLNVNIGALASGSGGTISFTEEKNPMLDRIQFNIGVRTLNPIIIDNNLAEAEVEADLRVLGTPYATGLTGTVTIIEGGEVRLQERRYVVERGVVTFANERRIEPAMDILATTNVEGFDVRLQVSGQGDDTETTLTSDPPLPEPDIMALLLTGRRMDELRGQELDVARNQVLSYLTGQAGSAIGGRIAGATGLSRVRIEPNLIAAETDPSARLTIGQDITRNIELIYSMDLVNSSDQIYIAEYDISKRFTTRGVRQSDGSFRFDFRHDLRFGGEPEPRRGEKTETRRIGKVSLLGETFFPEPVVLDKWSVESGDRYDFFEVRKGIERLQKMYTKEGLLEANLRVKRDPRNGNVDLTLRVRPGPKVQLVYEGASVPKGIRERVRGAWQSGVFDAQRADDAEQVLTEWLVKEGYLRPTIEYTITEPMEDQKRVLFDMQVGTRYRDVELEFDGAEGIEPERLRDIVKSEKLSEEVYTDPDQVRDLLKRFYAEMGYLSATIAEPEYKLDAAARSGVVVFPVKEGPLFRIGNIRFEGNEILSDGRLAEAAPIQPGDEYRPVLRQNVTQRVHDAYAELAFNSAEVDFVLERREGEDGIADVTIRVQEGPQTVMQEVVVEGNRATSTNLVRSQIHLDTGDILSWDELSKSRRNLYNTGAYSLVEMVREPLPTDVPGLNPVRLRVKVREIQPFQFRYGAFYDTERGIGLIGDFAIRNLLGSARELGLRTRYDSQLREARVYFSQPTLRRFPLKTIVSPYIRRELFPETEFDDAFNVDRTGVSVQQEALFGERRAFLLNYGYRLERSRTYVPSDPEFDIPLQVGTLTSSFRWETRDDVLDATRGQFLSHAFEFSPTALGSDLNFMKYFGQYFRYIPLQKERLELFTNEVIRPRLVFASGARIGLARGFGDQRVPLSERFFGGGSTTIRGFVQNSLGPQVIEGIPEGGQAMLVFNNELRFPIWSIFDGVGFVDIGNVYPFVSDLSLANIRKAGGFGLRVRTPWFLLRMDYGIKFDRRPGESSGRLFFSIGQAF
jgi:outer membrane protein assembly complex protein YaeT